MAQMLLTPHATTSVSLNLLLVEDNPGDAALLSQALGECREARIQVRHVDRLQAAVAELGKTRFDVVVLDVGLPDSDELEGLHVMLDRAPGVPIVLLSGREDPGLAMRFIHEGAQDYLVKWEVTPQTIVRTLRSSIVRKHIETELDRQRQHALEASKAKTAFVAAMSHEIRTPLNAILGMADLLLETRLEPEQEEYVRIFQRCGRVLLGLLNNVLEISKIESGQMELERIEFDLEELLGDVVEMFGFRAHKKRLGLSLELDADVPHRVTGDATRLRQVVANLLSNAIRFTDTGDVGVRVLREAGGDAEQIRFEVTDTGVGVPAGKRDAIFERFVQADAQVTRLRGGTGLGLALCRDLVECMGGEIGVRSEVGVGSCFFFLLPLRVAESQHVPEPESEPSLAGARALVVTSSLVEGRALTELLSRWGARALLRSSVDEAVETLAEALERGDRFELAAVDSRLPSQGGLAVARWVHEHPGSVERLAVLLPMDHRFGDVARCHELGATPVMKPVRSAALRAALAEPAGNALAGGSGTPPAEPAHLAGVRILLADDAEDNRTLLLVYLRKSGCSVEVAEDGGAALRKFRSGRYDVVLMDMQMPVLDGYETTRRIRALEVQEGRGRTPIVAITAYAFREHERLSLEAGCDAHLAKPIAKGTLLSTIRSHLARPEPSGAEPAPIEVEIDPEIADLVPGYLANRRADLPLLRDALAAADFETLATLGHRMKGSGGAYGFKQITAIGGALEKAAKDADAAGVESHRAELEDLLRRLGSAPDEAEPVAAARQPLEPAAASEEERKRDA